MIRTLKFLAIVLTAGLLWGCYPGSVSTSELDTVITVYDPDFDFKTVTTFHISDTILLIGEGSGEISDKFDDDIIARTRQNLLNAGYTEEADPEMADVLILLEKTRSDLIIVTPPPCYWCWYPGYPGYPPYYPWYPPGYVYTYPIGTVFATMHNTTPDEGMEVTPTHWSYAINGLITGSDQFILDRLDRAVDQAFTQSPYLNR